MVLLSLLAYGLRKGRVRMVLAKFNIARCPYISALRMLTGKKSKRGLKNSRMRLCQQENVKNSLFAFVIEIGKVMRS